MKNKHGQILVLHTCPECKKDRYVLRSLKWKHPLCKSCSAKARDARYILKNGRGRNWQGTKYFARYLINQWKYGAEVKRNIGYFIDDDYLDELWDIQKGICALTGLPMTFERNSMMKVSLDRIDSKKPYQRGNVQFTCSHANKAKQSLSVDDFIEMCKQIAKYRK